jgi:O-6-methylguanine DNA methyltransferase
VLSLVRRIPAGRVSTYGEIAEFAGRPRAGRAVGNIMSNCTSPDVPCHRVVGAEGRIGGFGGREFLKRSLLIAEGVALQGKRVRPFADFRWKGPRSKPSR